MRRREFLKNAGCFVATAGLGTWLGCDSDTDIELEPSEPSGSYSFPQGVASGDPQPGSVVLWTRVLPKKTAMSVPLRVEVSESEDFKVLVVKTSLEASAETDFTVRVLVDKLDPDRFYFYRFRADADKSRAGRTRTAPTPDADVSPRFAWVCCQDYSSNFFSAYRRLLNDDDAAPETEQLQFVLHIGDFIYETRDAAFMETLSDSLEPFMLKSKAGEPRVIGEFPSGGGMTSGGVNFANTVEDYRHVYKSYLLDPDLQDARARWPFVCVWDDHEFSDDCWQTQANYDRQATTDEPSQQRRLAASQAWFEYVPAALSGAKPVGDVAQAAKDLKTVSVETVPYSEVGEVEEPNNVKAIGAVTIYRNFRWGKHLELVLTDSRSYRSDHAMAEEVTKDNILIFHPRIALPKDAVNAMDAGRTANDGKPADVVLGFTNTRKDTPPGTLLGTAQKKWWKDVMRGSDATFKVWGNSVPLLRILLDRSDVPLIPNDLLLSPDAWDGYNTERKELMGFLKDEGISNVVSLSGDHHAHYAGVVMDDFDADKPSPVMVDIATAGISSNSQWALVAAALSGAFAPSLAAIVAPVKQLITYDSTALGGTEKAVPNLNTLIRYGSHAANVAAATHDLKQIEAARNPAVNSHLRYADSRAIGYGIATVSADALEATLVTIERSYEDLGKDSPEIRGRAKLRVARVEKPEAVELAEPELSGKKPFPLA